MSDFPEEFAAELAKQVAEKVAAPITLPSTAIGEAIAGHIKSWRWVQQGRLKNKKTDAEIDFEVKQTIESLEAKVLTIPPDRLQVPPLHIYGPALQALSYSVEYSDLRELFTNLLAKSMDQENSNSPLPSYTEILKQLSPDEARIVKHFADEVSFIQIGESGLEPVSYYLAKRIKVWPIGRLRMGRDKRITYGIKRNHIVSLNIALDNPDKLSIYIDNLRRLGVIEIKYGETVIGKIEHIENGVYMGLIDKDWYEDIDKALESPYRVGELVGPDEENYIERGHFLLTELGIQFIFCTVFPINGKMHLPSQNDDQTSDNTKENHHD